LERKVSEASGILGGGTLRESKKKYEKGGQVKKRHA